MNAKKKTPPANKYLADGRNVQVRYFNSFKTLLGCPRKLVNYVNWLFHLLLNGRYSLG